MRSGGIKPLHKTRSRRWCGLKAYHLSLIRHNPITLTSFIEGDTHRTERAAARTVGGCAVLEGWSGDNGGHPTCPKTKRETHRDDIDHRSRPPTTQPHTSSKTEPHNENQ